ncbi:MAG: hypothetical protein MMC23_005508 [Stictis urceolatum]|nr:hypothetical protein [Stictis urceolata]
MPNRKERRAGQNADPSHGIHLTQPDRAQPKHKTLYDLAKERESELAGGQPFSPTPNGKGGQPQIISQVINPDGSLSSNEEISEIVPHDDPIGPLGNAIFYAISLTMLHLTLDVLVHNQYAERIDWNVITSRTMQTFPLLLVMVYLLHSRASELWAQGIFLAGCIGAGCYLAYTSSEEPWFAVMKRAPPVGTLWVWSVLELRLEFAILGLAVVGSYFWHQGYSIYGS